MLEDYPETYQQDFEILTNEKLTSNQRNCVLYRQTEKRILKFFVDSAERIIPFFSMTFKNAKIAINQQDDFENCVNYVRNNIFPLIA